MRMLRLQEVISTTGLSRSSIYRLIESDEFPKSVQLGGRSVAWVDEEINDWLLERIAQRDAVSGFQGGK
ncbi:MAG: AlpA family transcriptional regulator [Cellvibrionaceae bacterium]